MNHLPEKLVNIINGRKDLIELGTGLPIIGEIPHEPDKENNIVGFANERAPIAESFRILSSNLKFIFSGLAEKKCKVIITTSTIKGEGKTFVAINLAATYAALNKKVLVIGADLHNPQLHNYLNMDKSTNGLSNYLVDPTVSWKKFVINVENQNCDLLLCGNIPPNPAQLLTNGNLDNLLEEAKKSYDYIIFDTPPLLLVSDTLSIVNLSDVIIYVVRCNHTEKEVISYLNDNLENNKIRNVSLVLNGIGEKSTFGYAYNYSYGYNYSYNYGYGYGYGSDETS